MNKRSFLKNTAGLLIPSLLLQDYYSLFQSVSHMGARELSSNEEFWQDVRDGYDLKSEYINLENGYYCITPKVILNAYKAHIDHINLEGSYYMRKNRIEDKKKITAELAKILGADPEEVIITRNTTESLDTVISGYSWKKGDEAIWSIHDYGSMQDQFLLMEKRWGISNKIVTLPLHPKSDEEIVEIYRQAISPRTKLLMVCHMINISGQILPVRKICDMAHEYGVDVMVDGAHTFAHLNFSISDLNCDYYGTSLHKWLSAPIGSGLLYMKKEKINDLWPMFAEHERPNMGINKFNHTGTHPPHTDLSILNAIEYYKIMGAERKESRLRFLQRYWSDQLREVPGVVLNTPVEESRSCAIANVGIEGMKPREMANILLDKYNIWTVPINNDPIIGCRITPNVYTTTAELDQLVSAVKSMV